MRMKPSRFAVVALLFLGSALAAAAQDAPARPVKVRVTAEQANLRESADIGSSIVQMIPEGAVLDADRKEGEWYFVRFTLEDGGVIGGFIHESLVEVVGGPAPAPPPEERTAPAARPRERGPRSGGIGRIEKPEFRTGSFPLELSVSAGAGPVSPRQLNDGTKGYAAYTGAVLGIPVPGSPDTLGLALLAGFELTYRVSPELAVGLGADYIRGANGDTLVFTDGLVTERLVTKPSARAVPVKLVVRYYPGAGFYARGGLGIYSARAGYLYRNVGAEAWEQWKGTASASGIGAEAALGGEWEIAPRTAFFAEAGFRLARFGGLTGKNVYTNSAGDAVTEPGTLYYFHRIAPDENAYPLLFVMGSPPEGEDIVDYRRAAVDLSGTAVRAGVRFRF